MTKYILQIGLETDIGLFDIADKLREIFLKEIDKKTYRNHVIVRLTIYEKIEDQLTKLEGINNGSGYGFHIIDRSQPMQQITE